PELDEEDDNLSQASFSTRSTASTFTSGTSKRLCTNNSEKYSKVLWMAQIRGELQREKFIKSIILDDQIAVPVGDKEIDDSILEPPELDVDDIDDKSDNGDNDEVDEFIKLWFEGLNEEDISENDTSDNEINENLNELL
ncbi:18595_t:CDS:2, partial [Rhizophagus irregularis]